MNTMTAHEKSRQQMFAEHKPLIEEAMTYVPGWWTEDTSLTTEWGMVFVRMDGVAVFATIVDFPASQRGRIEISLAWSREFREVVWNLPSDQITAAPTRSPKAIAGQVAKMVEKHTEDFERVFARVEAHRTYVSHQTKIMNRMTAIPGTELRENDQFHLNRGQVWGHGRVFSDSVTLELHSLTPEQAEAILTMLG